MFYWLLAICASYIIALIILAWQWRQLETYEPSLATGQLISVIVPFRNEALNMERLLSALLIQSYQNFEVIFINDHSEDDSVALLEALLKGQRLLNFTILNLEGIEGKKAAITKGIAASKGALIVTTDADCWFESNWLASMVSHFEREDVMMVTGPVILEGNSFFQNCQRIEFGALLATSASLIHMGKPTMANGANLAYRKSAFVEVEGFKGIDQIPSGDDELLMMKIVNNYPNGICFAKSAEAVVKTQALRQWSAFKQQRKRWASKWKVGKRISTIVAALYVYLIQVAFVAVIGLSVFDIQYLPLVLILWFVKIVCEWILVQNYFFSLKQRFSNCHFLVLQTFYPFYVLYFGLLANFGAFSWKGRSFKI
jgi:biofilm PGA synthesis N-glycosyltransferase PgaC